MDRTKEDKMKEFYDFITGHLEDAHNFARIYVRNPEDAEDIVSESIVKALKRINTYREPWLMKQWFYKIIVNTAFTHLKKQAKHESNKMKQIDSFHFESFSRLEFEEILEILPNDSRQIALLRFNDDLELKDIAKKLGINENTVKSKLYRALAKLKLEINEDGERKLIIKETNITKNITTGVVVLLVIAACVFNLSPALAKAASDIPIIGDVIRAITFNRFEYKDAEYNAEILVPEIQGLLDQELQDRLNTEFREYADELIQSFEAAIPELEELGDESAHMSIKADYEVKTDNDKVLSIDAFIFSDVNGFVIHKFCTIDKQKGTLISLPDLFKPNIDYVIPISEYILTEMKRINEEEGGAFDVGDSPFDGFTEIKPDNNFYVNKDGNLVICFDKYEVAAGFMGSPEFVIPPEIVKDILSSDVIK